MTDTITTFRKRVLLFSLALALLCGVAAAVAAFYWNEHTHFRRMESEIQGIAGDSSLLLEERASLVDRIARYQEGVQDAFAGHLVPPDLLYLVLCDNDGRVRRTLFGGSMEGLRFPSRSLRRQWMMNIHFTGSERLCLSYAAPSQGGWLVAGFEPSFLFSRIQSELPGSMWALITESRGQVLASWNDRERYPPGSYVAQHMTVSESESAMPLRGEMAWGAWDRWQAIPMAQGLQITGGVWLDRMVPVAVKGGIVAALAVLLLGALLLAPLDRGFARVTRSFRHLTSLIGELDGRLQQSEDPFAALLHAREKWRLPLEMGKRDFREARQVEEALNNLLNSMGAQGQELAALYEETRAIEEELQQSNWSLRKAFGRLEELATFSQTAMEARSVQDACTRSIGSLIDFSGARAGTVVAFTREHQEVVAFQGSEEARKVLDQSLRGELFRIFGSSGKRERELERGGFRWYLFPVYYLGEAEGAILLALPQGERMSRESAEALHLFVPHLGGMLHAQILMDEIRHSYHYLAVRLQHVSATYHDETGEHLRRIRAFSVFLAEQYGLNRQNVEDIGLYSMLHDIGKLRVPREILLKPGPVTEEEFGEIKRHVHYGVEALGNATWLSMAREICLYHHERWDGSGYPEGLSGRRIPLSARIVGLADVYDALRTSRVYKPAFSHQKTTRIILEGDGRVQPDHFDPDLLEIFRANHHIFERIYREVSRGGELFAIAGEDSGNDGA
ncbi:MAG: HD-GYP domain-containing protein [Synergistales bacterium]|nr:HD-GYP domain-containing protein [Synergistales bacterium]